MVAVPGKVFVVLNTGSGRRDRAEALRDIEATLQAAGRPYDVLKVARGRDLAAAAARAAGLASGCDGILAGAGGDGTLSSVAHAALDADVRFGVVPLGTFNYFARENGIPLEPAQAAAVLVHGSEHPVQVGLVNGHVFLVNASLGFYPRLLEDREAFKQQYGRTRWVALIAALWTLLARTHPKLVMRITARGEGRRQRISTLFVGNNPLQLARLGIKEAQAVEAGQLAAIRVRPTGPWGMLDILLYGAVGRLGQAAGVEAFAFDEMEVAPLRASRRPPLVKVAADGESLRLKLPLRFRVAPRRLRLLRPAGGAG
ncbi:MAG TPA: diacylglycerol kinase family protein [Burkholderiales bacterium]|nr:diacylglycerol kinase family protein [Burkholderiales bacterium]